MPWESLRHHIIDEIALNRIDMSRGLTWLSELDRVTRTADSALPSGTLGERTAVDVAIIGMSGRFPGAPDLDQLALNLEAGVDAVSEIPRDRWAAEAFYDPDPRQPGRSCSKWGGFLTDIDQFDPLFFRISPKEAAAMDPMQRLFLEVSWAALEDAGYSDRALAGQRCGVYVGAAGGDFGRRWEHAGGEVTSDTFFGQTPSLLPTRLCYLLDLKGSALTIDTACSSSLVATHLACQSLINGDNDLMVAGGVCVINTEALFLMLSKNGMLSPRGRCRAFDAEADGMVLAEGVGAVVLKRLDRAIADGDRIDAVIKASAINQDGATNGVAAPCGPSQTALARRVYEASGINPATIGMVEAHGTGTPLGDPIELRALSDAFRSFTSDERFCAIGSVKSNIGHAQTAAGIASLLKAVLSLRNRKIYRTLHVEAPTPHFDFEASPFYLARATRDWLPPAGAPRRAAVSSFGASGTNCHLLLEEGPPRAPAAPLERPAWPVVISAKRAEALQLQVRRWLEHLQRQRDSSLADVSFTSCVGRSHFRHRLALVARDRADLQAQLAAAAAGDGRWPTGKGAAAPHDPLAAYSDAALDAMLQESAGVDLLGAVARAFIAGSDVAWQRLFPPGSARRVALPTSPLQRQSFRLPAAPLAGSARPLGALLDENVSDAGRLVFSKRIDRDAFFVRDHRMRGARILPGVAYLEMATRAAQAIAPRAGLNGVVQHTWVAPLEVRLRPAELSVELTRHPEGFDYQIRSGRGPHAVLHAQGRVASIVERPSARWAPDALLGDDTLDADAHYGALLDVGVERDGCFRCVERIRVSERAVWASVRVPGAAATSDFRLHPGLLDGVLQVVAPLVSRRGNRPSADGSSVAVPFCLKQLHWFGVLPEQLHVHAVLVDDSPATSLFDIDVFSPGGDVVLGIRGYGVRFTQPPAAAVRAPQGVTFVGRTWVSAPRSALTAETSPLLWLGPSGLAPQDARIDAVLSLDATADLEAQLACPPLSSSAKLRIICMAPPDPEPRAAADLVLALARLFGVLARAKVRDAALLLLLPPGAPLLAAAAGLLACAEREQPRHRCRALALPFPSGTDWDLSLLLDELPGAGHGQPEVRYREGRRERLVLEDLGEPMRRVTAPSLLRRHGTYLITGGAGGIGALLAGHLLRTLSAKVVIVGRGAPSASVSSWLRESASGGGAWRFAAGDVADRDDVRGALAECQREFGVPNGIFHCAGVTRDGWLSKKTDGDVRAVLQPKVEGAVLLDELSAEMPLDFLALFSSSGSLISNPGQAEYAAANRFLDEFAVWRRERRERGLRHGSTLAISWPYWAEGGMRLPEDKVRALAESAGMWPLETPVGLELLTLCLASTQAHVGVFRGDAPRIAAALGLRRPTDDAARASDSAAVSVERGSVEGRAAPRSAAADRPSPGASELSRPGAAASPLADPPAVLDDLSRRISALTHVPLADIDPHGTWGDYGMDSVTLTELCNQLNERYSTDLTPAVFFELDGIGELAAFLSREAAARVESSASSRAPEGARPCAASPAADAGPASSRELEVSPGAPPEASVAAVAREVAALLSELAAVPAAMVDLDAELVEYGLDRVLATELASRLGERFGCQLSAGDVLEARTIVDYARRVCASEPSIVAARLARCAAGIDVQPANAAPPSARVVPAPLDGLGAPATKPRVEAAHDVPRRSTRELSEPIAVIGVAARLPGHDDLERWWQKVLAGECATREVPRSRFDWKACFDEVELAGVTAQFGGFIDDVDKFDAEFFKISRREAALMDPQHRLFLELSWRALEDAGLNPRALSRTRTGVFVGVTSNDYSEILAAAGLGTDAHAPTGNAHCLLPNRVSYLLNLEGPSEPVNTACSSSLVAIHRAVRSLQSGESSLALAGGVNLLLTPSAFVAFNRSANMLARDGRCKTFDASADGYVRGEGAGVVVLETLAQARAQGHPIYAVIRGTAVNHGGHAASLTAPNPNAQADLIAEAYREANFSPRSVTHVEAHGTGTRLGDPIEISGLEKAFARLSAERGEASARGSCGLASIKTNIGHLEAAAGIAGVIKVLLAMRDRRLPASLHFEHLNPGIRLDGSPFFILDRARDWQPSAVSGAGSGSLRAGVSSFGFGGANAHVALESHDEYRPPSRASAPFLFVFSARAASSLEGVLRHFRCWLEQPPGRRAEAADIAHTLQFGREPMAARLAVIARDKAELDQRIAQFLEAGGHPGEGCWAGEGRPDASASFVARPGALADAARAFAGGATLDWSAFEALGRLVHLPGYAFERRRHWAGEKAPLATSAPRPQQPRSPTAEAGATDAERRRRFLRPFIERYSRKHAASKALAQQGRMEHADPRAVARYYPSLKELCFPLTLERADGAQVWDVDGNAYVDVCMDSGCNLFGHGAPFIVERLERQLDEGYALGLRPPASARAAALLCRLTGHERAVFAQSGTEAVMTAIRLARHQTGRHRIVVFAGSYHGQADGVLVRAALEKGQRGARVLSRATPPGLIEDVTVLDYDAPDSLAWLREHASELAGVLVEPVQARHLRQRPGPFLRELRALTSAADCALIFDEVLTGLRLHAGGACAWFGVRADLCAYGKALAGGLGQGAIAGAARYLDGIDGGFWRYGDDSFPPRERTFFAGTHSQNTLGMAAVEAVLTELERSGPALQSALAEQTAALAARVNRVFDAEETPLTLEHCGSIFRVEPSADLDPVDEALFSHVLRDRGVLLGADAVGFLSTAHTEEHLDQIVAAVGDTLHELRAAGYLPRRAPSHTVAPEPRRADDSPASEPPSMRSFSDDERRAAE